MAKLGQKKFCIGVEISKKIPIYNIQDKREE